MRYAYCALRGLLKIRTVGVRLVDAKKGCRLDTRHPANRYLPKSPLFLLIFRAIPHFNPHLFRFLVQHADQIQQFEESMRVIRAVLTLHHFQRLVRSLTVECREFLVACDSRLNSHPPHRIIPSTV